jgi:hypothetical protein
MAADDKDLDAVASPVISFEPNGNRIFEVETLEETQSQRIIRKLGGVAHLLKLLEAIGRPKSKSSIYRWGYPKDKNGCGGLIPTSAWPDILAAARLEGIIFTAEDMDPRSSTQVKKTIYATKGADGEFHEFKPLRERREEANRLAKQLEKRRRRCKNR